MTKDRLQKVVIELRPAPYQVHQLLLETGSGFRDHDSSLLDQGGLALTEREREPTEREIGSEMPNLIQASQVLDH